MFHWREIWIWRAAFIVCLLGVLTLAALPNSAALMTINTGWDKANHALAFFILGTLGLRAFPGPVWRLILGLFAYGVLIELLQGMTTWRTADWQDVAADMVGLLAALGVGAARRRAHLRFARPGAARRDGQ